MRLHPAPEQEMAALVQACKALNHAWPRLAVSGRFKQQAEDFRVEENLGFEPDGSGEHLFLFVEKRELTTREVHLQLARHFGVAPDRVSWSGMKDKLGITRQWFSVQTGTAWQAETLPEFSDQIQVLRAHKNSRKLRIGSHRSNHFRLVLREVTADSAVLDARIQLLAQQGVPNYFGPQRFGNECSTLLQAWQWLAGNSREHQRAKRSMLLSAARAFLFNQVLSERVARNNWNQAESGDVMALSGSASTFAADKAAPDELRQRLASMDIHPTGPLWGRGSLRSAAEVAALEMQVAQSYSPLATGLERQGLEQERRALRLQVQDLKHELSSTDLLLEFTLPKGAYATAVLRELLTTDP